jgi:pyridoxine/pyridoxamine 5'-phosphate oxidase
MKKKIKKGFDCIKFKRQIQAKIYEEIKNMTAKEQIVYFQKQAESGSLGAWWKSLQNRNMSASRNAKQRNKSKNNVYALKEKQG